MIRHARHPGPAFGRPECKLDPRIHIVPYSDMKPRFVPTARQTNWLLIVGFLSVGWALWLRYRALEFSEVSLACQAGLDTWLCGTFRTVIVLYNHQVFGAVAAGPTIGGIQANAHGWRPLFGVVAGISLVAFLLSLLTFEDAPPADRSAQRDPAAIGLAAAGSATAFFGASGIRAFTFSFNSSGTGLVLRHLG